MKYLEGGILNSTRLYLLHGRKKPLEGEDPKQITVFLQHYLTLVVNSTHRKALTRLLLSQHPLAVEHMHYKGRYHRVHIPRERQLCRFACNHVETVEHALFHCTAKPELVEWRGQFVEKVAPCWHINEILDSLQNMFQHMMARIYRNPYMDAIRL
jgi:hypothetical protein